MKTFIVLFMSFFNILCAFSQDLNEISYKQDDIVVVENIKPEFPGGMKACMDYLDTKIRYPKYAFKNNIEGCVIVEFLVEEDGEISDEKILKGVHPSLDNAVIRAIKKMPKWDPGMIDGNKVSIKYFIPVIFKVTSSDKVESDVHI